MAIVPALNTRTGKVYPTREEIIDHPVLGVDLERSRSGKDVVIGHPREARDLEIKPEDTEDFNKAVDAFSAPEVHSPTDADKPEKKETK